MHFSAQNLAIRFAFFLAISFLILFCILYITTYQSNPYIIGFISIICAILIWAALQLATIRIISNNWVRTVAIYGAATISCIILQGAPLVEKLLSLSFGQIPQIGNIFVSQPSYAVVSVVVLWVVIIYLALRRFGDQPAMGINDVPVAQLLPSANDSDRLEILRNDLLRDLNDIDRSTQWSDGSYVPLSTDVQILGNERWHRRVIPIGRALRVDNKTPLTVILGEPGSGKSVALRKVTRDLMRELNLSKRLPVYINLKEWRPKRPWSEDHPPTGAELRTFILDNLSQRVSQTSATFLRENLDRLQEAGFFFFVLDSFDEIPAVLDVNEGSWLVGRLSTLSSHFILGGKGSSGIIASRIFRQPQLEQVARRVLVLRPLSETQISDIISKTAAAPEPLIREILTNRPDLGVLARNPFLLGLIVQFHNEQNQLPVSQLQLYENIFAQRINNAFLLGNYPAISSEHVNLLARRISLLMFNSPNSGLEMSISEMEDRLNDESLRTVIHILTNARLARLSEAFSEFSFSHRRFNEFLLVQSLMQKPELLEVDAIQTDSRWRDALVLYAEVTSEDEASRIATHAWTFAKKLEFIHNIDRSNENLEVLLSLSFFG